MLCLFGFLFYCVSSFFSVVGFFFYRFFFGILFFGFLV